MTTGDSDSPASSSHNEESNDTEGKERLWPPAMTTPTTTTTGENGVGALPKVDRDKRRTDVDTHVIQVANIAPQATRDQMQTLFGYIGKIDDLRLYPSIDLSMMHTSKICFVKFRDTSSVGVAQHLTNTVFVDRALIVIPYPEGDIPDELKGVDLLSSGSILPGIADPKLPQHVTSQLEGIPPMQVVVTRDSKLQELQLPPYPNLPPTFDSRRIEEIRRTIMIANIDSAITSEEVLEFFCSCGEVKYLRMCSRDNDPLQYALIEFTEQPSILFALQRNGTKLGSKHIKVYHSTQSIVKPQAKTNEAAQKEIEEAMTRQAQNLLTQGLETNPKEKRRSRSLSRGRHVGSRRRSRTRSRSPRRRSRSRSKRRRSRSRSRSPRRRRRSRSRSTGRVLRSPWRHRSRSRSEERKRSSSKSRRVKRSSSRDRDRRREKKAKKDKDRDRDKEKEKRPKDRDRETKDKSKENGVKSQDDKEESEKPRDREHKRDKRRSTSRSPAKEKHLSGSGERERKKSSKSKKKKRGGSEDRDGSVERRRGSSERDPQSMDIE